MLLWFLRQLIMNIPLKIVPYMNWIENKWKADNVQRKSLKDLREAWTHCCRKQPGSSEAKYNEMSCAQHFDKWHGGHSTGYRPLCVKILRLFSCKLLLRYIIWLGPIKAKLWQSASKTQNLPTSIFLITQSETGLVSSARHAYFKSLCTLQEGLFFQ